jgi:hypothetical protein
MEYLKVFLLYPLYDYDLPIWFVTSHIICENTRFSSTLIVVALVFLMDVLLAFIVHQLVKIIKSILFGQRSKKCLVV